VGGSQITGFAEGIGTSIYFIFALLLVFAGVAKLRHPSSLRDGVFAGLSWTLSTTTARSIGLGECAIGVAALFVGSRWSAAGLSACYGLFALFVWTLLQRGSQSSCGCLGKVSVPPSLLHVTVNLIAVGSGIYRFFSGGPTIVLYDTRTWTRVLVWIAIGLGASLVSLVVAYGPTSFGAWKSSTDRTPGDFALSERLYATGTDL
jgi:hypothetical protein